MLSAESGIVSTKCILKMKDGYPYKEFGTIDVL